MLLGFAFRDGLIEHLGKALGEAAGGFFDRAFLAVEIGEV